jgi:hypothetical protein
MKPEPSSLMSAASRISAGLTCEAAVAASPEMRRSNSDSSASRTPRYETHASSAVTNKATTARTSVAARVRCRSVSVRAR